MKGKKLLLVVLVAAFLLLGWGLAMRNPKQTENAAEQEKLVADADAFMEKKLYIRAIPLYLEALEIETTDDVKDSIQEKLMKAYYDDGDAAEYVMLAQERSVAGTATEDEFFVAAQSFIATKDLKEAFSILKTGMEKYESDKLTELYFQNRYPYEIEMTLYSDIRPSVENEIMPAYDGTGWQYIGNNTKTLIEGQYQDATAFSSAGYAAVKKEGIYYVINTDGKYYSIDDAHDRSRITEVKYIVGKRVIAKLDGKYRVMNYDFEPYSDLAVDDISMNSCGNQAVCENGQWRLLKSDLTDLSEERFEAIARNSLGCVFENNVGMLKKNGKWIIYYTNGEDQIVATETAFADAKAPESDEYIAVADQNGRWGFVNKKGETVIDCQYDDAFSFSDNVAAVKIDDKWSYIGMEGNIVFDELEFDEALPFHNGIAQAKIDGNVVLINLKYFE